MWVFSTTRASSHRARHRHRPSPLAAWLCQETCSSTTLDSQNKYFKSEQMPSAWPRVIGGTNSLKKALGAEGRCRRPLGRCQAWLSGPPEHSPYVEARKTHFRREEVVLQQEPSQEQKSRFLSQLCSSEQIPLALGLRFL